MLRTTISGLVAHKVRLLTTALAVLLGVAFMAGTLVLTDTLGEQMDSLVADTNAGTDAYIRTESSFSAAGQDVRDRIDAATLDQVRAVPGVAAAAGRIRGWAQLVDADGEPLGGGPNGAPAQGESWIAVPELNPYTLAEGAGPAADDQIAIDRASADALGVSVGATVQVLVKGGPTSFNVSGIVTFGEADSVVGASTVLFTDAAAQRLVAEPGRYDGIAVVAEAGTAPDELVARLADALPESTEVLAGEALTAEQQDDVAEGLSFFNTFMLTFAVIALFVGSFIIFNTFSIVVAQRSRELAVLRALGASRRQVLGSVVLESVVVGLFASAAGLAAGVGVASLLRSMLEAMGIDVPDGALVVAPASLLTALLVGVAITVASAVVPARRASRIAPVAAMRATAVDESAGSRRRIAIGTIMTAVGAVAMAAGLGGNGSPLGLVAIGAVLVFFGVAVLGPVLARPVSRLIGAPFAARGVFGVLARENAARSPKRTAATASALMIGVALVGCITVLASSVKASTDSIIAGSLEAEYIVESGNMWAGGLDPSLAATVSEVDGVESVTGLRQTPALIDGTGMHVTAMDTATASRSFDFDVTDGTVEGLGTDGIAIAADEADDRGWAVGDRVAVTFDDGATQDLTVRGLYEADAVGSWLVDTSVVETRAAAPYDSLVFVNLDDGVDVDALRPAIEAVTDQIANAELLTGGEWADQQAGQVDQMLGIVYAMLALAIVIAVLGIANTLALSVFERTRELSLLRAVGMARSQVRRMVRAESVIVALLGTALGMTIGVGFGVAIVDALGSEGIETLVIPGGSLMVIVALAAVAGVVAAALPARRAAGLDVLTGLQAS